MKKKYAFSIIFGIFHSLRPLSKNPNFENSFVESLTLFALFFMLNLLLISHFTFLFLNL
jgi:hypothetical protein